MNLQELAKETADIQIKSESEAFERAIGTFKVNDEVEQAFRAGFTAHQCCDDIRIEQIASHYGFTSQSNMLCEEAAEFMVALSKLRRGNATAFESIKEEVADVLIMARQLRYLLGYKDIDSIIESKLNRQLQRIAEEKDEKTG